MLIIGSQALKAIAPHLIDRWPRDYDLVGTWFEVKDYLGARRSSSPHLRAACPIDSGKKYLLRVGEYIVEIEIAWPGSSAEDLLRLAYPGSTRAYFQYIGIPAQVPSLDWLYTIKHSHRFKKNSPHFLKTMADWRAMRGAGARIADDAWLSRRERETYDYSHPKLNKSRDEFFNQAGGVQYSYDHDSIHVAVAHMECPAYLFFKRLGSEVMCDKALFFAASEQVRLAAVVEEAYVLALERSQIPHPGKMSPRRSFEIALEKICTSITSGWFREYSYEHYHDAIAMYEDDYVDRFWAAVEAGIVKKLLQETPP